MQITIKTKAAIDKKRPELCARSCPRIQVVNPGIWALCRAYNKELAPDAQSLEDSYNGEYTEVEKVQYRRCRECRVNFLRI